jgi:hypothetical protein
MVQGGQVLRQPGYPRSLGPVAFPASMSKEAGPPLLRRAGVPRLLVVWLYRQYPKFFPVPVFFRAILVPKDIECFNPLISKGLLETLNSMEEEKVPFFCKLVPLFQG